MQNLHYMSAPACEAFTRLAARLEPRLRECCAPRDADLFLIRLERYFQDFYGPLAQIYGERSDFLQQLDTLGEQMLDAYADRSEPLRLLDIERQMTPDWFQRETMVGYVCYPDLFAGTLRGVREHLNYLRELGVTYLHLMPILQPRSGTNDGGYAVEDYRQVNPVLGTMADLVALAGDLHTNGISLCIDLVLNHTAREHTWAQRAMAGEPEYLDFYHTFADRTLPDSYEATLREVFPDFASGNFTWYPHMAEGGRWVWTTFNEFQWDLNYTNPAVFRAMADTMFFLANQGVDILRLDAVPFIWKRVGTDCENQPEVHLLLQAFRGVMRVVAPAVIFKAEAIVPPDKLIPYLGLHAAEGKECELAYNNQLMVQLWSALATHDVTLLTHVLHAMPAPPTGTTWITYLRCHDDIGWAITDEYAAAVGANGFLHRQFLNEFYSGAFSGSFARGSLFQYNPVTRDARISGTTASLAGLEQALSTNDSYAIDLAVRRILLLHSIILAYSGIPLIYMGDELGMLNDFSFCSDPLRVDDNRWMHRPPMNWNLAAQRHDAVSVVGRIYAGLRRLITIRTSTPALHAGGSAQVMWAGNPRVFAFYRQHPRGHLLLLANFSEYEQQVASELMWHGKLRGEVRNLLDPEGFRPTADFNRIHLKAYECMWLVGNQSG